MSTTGGAPQMRRWNEQRWLLDNVISAVGIDWDSPRLPHLNAALGPGATADINSIRQRVKKFADIEGAFVAVARRREALAVAAEAAEQSVTARENFYMASNYWASAQWTIDESNETNHFYNRRKRECYEKFAKLADHQVEAAWIPLQDKKLPAWFHLPPGYKSGRIPAVVNIPGMDGYKERSVPLYGDPWLNRGIAVLVVEGPGQYEAPLLGIPVTMPAWSAAGPAIMEWLLQRPEIDPQRIGITGRSFGSLFSTVAIANEPRFCAGAVIAVCLEPGCHTIFEEASPTFKKRFMWMSGFTDESAFDEFAKSLTWEGYAEKIHQPFLVMTGESDELSPLVHTERFVKTLPGPKQLLIYQDSRHTVSGVPSVNLGPAPNVLMCEWMAARLQGKSFASERWYVNAGGQVDKTPA
jgi:dipeptidyl aminopeptidase/acylaminoacyl peptidase